MIVLPKFTVICISYSYYLDLASSSFPPYLLPHIFGSLHSIMSLFSSPSSLDIQVHMISALLLLSTMPTTSHFLISSFQNISNQLTIISAMFHSFSLQDLSHHIFWSYHSIMTSPWNFAIFLSPGVEAHGGYSFCGFAALVLLGEEDKINIKKLLVSLATCRQNRITI